jgi:carbon-monoxide dehydrogenase large subunit
MERLVNMAAKKLGMDPVEFRMKNLVRPEEFPYKTPSGIVWDKSAFTEGLAAAGEAFSYAERREYQAKARAEGRLVGIGMASYAELSGIGSKISASPGMPINTGTDTCVISLDSTGAITAAFGCAAHGQGHETTLGQVVADELGAKIEDIRIITGDSTAVPHGTGSYASRTAVLSSGAGMLASQELKSRMASMAAYLFNTTVEDLRFMNSAIEQLSAPNRIEFAQLAKTVYSEMGRIPADHRLELTVTRTYDPIFGTTSSASHMVEVEVDPVTFKVDIKRYVIAEDCGQMINPLIVDGQIRGALAQGIGAALLEEVVYDEVGQVLTASLVDYAIPTALDIPDVKIVHMDIKAPNTLGCFRGVGEGGTIGSPAAIANAVADALSDFGCEVNELPVTPERIFQLINKQ